MVIPYCLTTIKKRLNNSERIDAELIGINRRWLYKYNATAVNFWLPKVFGEFLDDMEAVY